MKLIMAVSKDGYVARSEDDRMDWLGPSDKAVFRILTCVDGGVCGVSAKTGTLMPHTLEARKLILLSRSKTDWSLEKFSGFYPDGWLLGGLHLALVAIGHGLIQEAHICRSGRMAFPSDPTVYCDHLTDALREKGMLACLQTKVGDVTVECWRRG